MDYCNGVQDFINFTTSIPRNFTDDGIRCPYRKCKNKKFLHQDVVMMHLLTKGFMEDYLCWYAHGELFVPNESMVERVVGSSSNASNVHEVVNDNNNPYKKLTCALTSAYYTTKNNIIKQLVYNNIMNEFHKNIRPNIRY